MDHKIIGGVVLALLAVTDVLAGVFVVGRMMIDNIQPSKHRRLLLTWFICFGLLTVPQYYLKNYLTDGRTHYWPMVANNWPLYLMYLSGWISSQARRARKAKP